MMKLVDFLKNLLVVPRRRRAGYSLNTEPLECRRLLTNPIPVPALPSIVTVRDGQVLVQERLPDGSLGSESARALKGINYSPHRVGVPVEDLHLEIHASFQTDIPLLKEMGVNVVRVYHDFGTGQDAMEILDAFYRADIKVIVTVDSPQHGVNADTENALQIVSEYKRHPAILAWNIGNEWDINRYYGTFDTIESAAQWTENLAQQIKAIDPNHPVTTAIADPHIPGTHPLSREAFPNQGGPYTSEIVASMPGIDFWSIQVYRGDSFQDVIRQWKSISTTPILISEFGADAFDHRINAVNEVMQSQVDSRLWDELHFDLSAYRNEGVVLGGLVFEFQDEWWKNGTPETQTVTSEGNGGQPDGYNDEEVFGVTDIYRQPREAYRALQDRFLDGESAIVVNPVPLIRASSQVGGSSAQFQIDEKVVFSRAGGIFGARGINVFVLDSNTGIRLSDIRSFDTWRMTGGWGGPHDNFPLLTNYLDSLPDGTVFAMAIADEGGFIDPNADPHRPWNDSKVENAYQFLEGLGSTKIRDVDYRGGWVMIGIRGEGVLAENISDPNTPVSVEVPVSLDLNLDAGKRPNRHAPVISAIATQTVRKGNTLCLQVHGSDADRDELRFSLVKAPSGASIDPGRGFLSWTPAANQNPGKYTATIRATDMGSPSRSVTKTIEITVDGAVVQNGSTLYITGTPSDDTISIQQYIPAGAKERIKVTVNGVVYTYAAASVNSLIVNSGNGDDTITLTADVTKPATLNGGPGDDRLTGGGGNDVLNGSAGNDVLNGGAGNDTLAGGADDDTYVFGTASVAEADVVNESLNAGIDTLNFSALTTDVTISLGSSASQNVHPNRTVKLNAGNRVEKLIGGSGNDKLTGNALANTLTGNGGNDTLAGGAESDVLNGNAGNDVLNGGPGNDTLAGGANDDSYVFSAASSAEADVVNEAKNPGIDTLNFAAISTGVTLLLNSTTVQTVHANRTLRLSGTDRIENATGGSGNDILIGNALNNRLIGNSGNNVLTGNGGNDTLTGGSGRDILVGGNGRDTVSGGSGDDILIAGWTKSDTNLAKLIDMRTEWTSANSYPTRIANLRSGVGTSDSWLKAKVNVKDDAGEDDALTGGAGRDWVFRALDDIFTDLLPGETVDLL